jgi:hypothetical protein
VPYLFDEWGFPPRDFKLSSRARQPSSAHVLFRDFVSNALKQDNLRGYPLSGPHQTKAWYSTRGSIWSSIKHMRIR